MKAAVWLSLSALGLLTPSLGISATFDFVVAYGPVGNPATEAVGRVSDIGEGAESAAFPLEAPGGPLLFEMTHLKWPDGRSYASRLQFTVSKPGAGQLHKSFLSVNTVADLNAYQAFGFRLRLGGELIEVKVRPQAPRPGHVSAEALAREIVIVDVISNALAFQMIRPVVLAEGDQEPLRAAFNLDSHPYEVNLALHRLAPRETEFTYKLSGLEHSSTPQALQEFFVRPTDLGSFRRVMFAFQLVDGARDFKLIFYPAQGQRHPPAEVARAPIISRSVP